MKYLSAMLFAAATLAATLAAGCDHPTGASCPTTDAPTYAGFGSAFFAMYCTDCHSATSTNRHGAPSDINFDTEADIQQHLSDIDDEAASGPNATNADMPELDTVVTDAPGVTERQMLGEFLACEKAGT